MEHRRIIKQGAVVVTTEEDGSIEPTGTVTQGLFVGDTGFLSRFRLSLDGIAPSLMGSGEEKPHQAGYLFTNPALPRVPARSFGLVQRTAIEDEIVTITLAVRNMTIHPVDFVLSIDLDADFFDSFETRGVKREKRGQTFAVAATGTSLRFQYHGLDNAMRTTHVDVEPAMNRWEQGGVFFPIELEPNGRHFITLKVTCRTEVLDGTALVYGPQSSGALQPAWFEDERAGAMVQVLLSTPMAGSWGIRTMADTEKRHNPISYHNGSVWPFENALIGAGLRRYGYTQEADSIFDALVDASGYFEYRRWPEVYSGVPRDLVNVLGRQPDTSRPQAWSAASIFLWIQSWLGLYPKPFSKKVDVAPSLPEGIERLSLKDIAIGDSHLSLTLARASGGTDVHIDDNPDGLCLQITRPPMG